MAIFRQIIVQTYNHNSLKGVKTPLQLVSSVKIVGLCGEEQLAQTFKIQIEVNDPHSSHTPIFNRLLRIGFSEVYVWLELYITIVIYLLYPISSKSTCPLYCIQPHFVTAAFTSSSQGTEGEEALWQASGPKSKPRPEKESKVKSRLRSARPPHREQLSARER